MYLFPLSEFLFPSGVMQGEHAPSVMLRVWKGGPCPSQTQLELRERSGFSGGEKACPLEKKRAFCPRPLPPQLKSHLGSFWQVPLKLRLH